MQILKMSRDQFVKFESLTGTSQDSKKFRDQCAIFLNGFGDQIVQFENL